MSDPTYKNLSRIKDNTNNVIFQIKATGLESSKTFSVSGDVSGSASSDLTGNVAIPASINNGAVTASKIATDAVETDKIRDGAVTYNKIAASVYGGSIAEGSADKLATKIQVKNYVESVMSGQGTYRGKQTVATINSWTLANLNNQDRVMAEDAGTVTLDGSSISVRAGDMLILWKYTDGGVEHGVWQSSTGDFKVLQEEVDTDNLSGAGKGGTSRTLVRLQQSENGDVTATFGDISIASSQVNDKMSTYDGTGSDKTKIVTGEAVKAAIDSLDTNATSSDGTNLQVKVTQTNGLVSAVNVTTDNTENRSNKVSVWSGTTNTTRYPSEKLVKDSLDGKANKAVPTSAGNIATLDASGNLVDSQKGISDVADADHNHGYITNGGLITSEGQTAISNDCNIVYADQTGQIKKSTVGFDGSSDYKALTQKGTFEEIVKDVKLAGANAPLQKTNGVVTIPNAVATGAGETNGLMTPADKARISSVSEGANKVEASQTNGKIKIDNVETTVYTHPTGGANTTKGDTGTTARTPGFGETFKVTSQTVDSWGHTTTLQEHTVKIPDAAATPSVSGVGGTAGLMSATDKEKLDELASGEAMLDKDEVIAAALNDLNARISNAEDAINETNIGDRIADSLDVNVLKVGGMEFAPGTETPSDVSTSSSVGTSSKFAREDHTHKITVGIGDSEGQVKIADTNVPVNGWSSLSGKASSALQGVKVNGVSLIPDSNKVVSVPTAAVGAHGTVEFMSSSEAESMWAAAWAAAI